MIGDPKLAMRIFGGSLVVGALVFGGIMVFGTHASADDSRATIQVTLPNGEVLREMPDVWDLGSQLGGGVIEIPSSALGGSQEFMNGLETSGTIRLQADTRGRIDSKASSNSGILGQFRYQRVSGNNESGVIQIEPVGR